MAVDGDSWEGRGTGTLSRVRDAKNLVWVAVGAVAADRAITIAHWSHEANPLVTGLGATDWLISTIVLMALVVAIWYATELWRSRAGRALVMVIAALHVATTVTNGLVVFG